MNNVNGALDKAPELKGMDLTALCKAVGTAAVPESVATVVRNNGGGTAAAMHLQIAARQLPPP